MFFISVLLGDEGSRQERGDKPDLEERSGQVCGRQDPGRSHFALAAVQRAEHWPRGLRWKQADGKRRPGTKKLDRFSKQTFFYKTAKLKCGM
jgi:hypothetical protein